jgi:hypothetical protein
MTGDEQGLARLYLIIGAALGRPFPEDPAPTRGEMLAVSEMLSAASELAKSLADAVERWEGHRGGN